MMKDITRLKKYLEEFSEVNVLVIGDIIIDEYVFCNVVGLMSKDRGLSVRYKNEDRYLGGTLAIARHISGFAKSTTVCSLIGEESHIHTKLLNELSKTVLINLSIDKNFKTVVKRRIIEKHGEREEYSKLFSINNIMEKEELSNIDREPFYCKLNEIVGEYDLVIVSDFGHGVLDQRAMDIVQDKSVFLSLNCQTNSTNYGTNLITKYKHADSFSLDEREIGLAFSTSEKDYDVLIKKLKDHLGSKYGWLTLGSAGAMGIDEKNEIECCEALTLNVKDTVGAGDAFFSISSLCAKTGVNRADAIFMANIAGAIAANTLGNSKPVTKERFMAFAERVLEENNG